MHSSENLIPNVYWVSRERPSKNVEIGTARDLISPDP